MSREILQDIIKDFEINKFSRFFRSKNRSFAPRQQDLSNYDTDILGNGQKLGEIGFEDGNFIVCAFETNQALSERSGKRAQYEVGKKILKDTQNDAGIFIFYDEKSNFRFSLIYTNYLGSRRDWSTFRRFTYFVSKELTNKTFLQRISDGKFSTIDEIKDAFSVDKVTNKFFEEFRGIFEKTKKEFQSTNKNTACLWLKDRYSDKEFDEQINKYAYTFLGRIVFLYFLLRKGWIENQKDFIRKSVEDESSQNLYSSFFLPLFFDVFAKKESDRPEKIRKAYQSTPYLNGGLFEKSELENEMEKAGIFILFDDSFIRSVILDFFEAYNFTIDENSPDDQEVSIDPEMLGKVFENTLAEEERGKKGTFYTPREIVHFMVKDSLWRFLKNETNLDHQKLHDFIFDPDYDLDTFSKPNLRLIDNKLENLKVLDPAVGSAAFPVEMMQILVNLRKCLDVKVGRNISEVNLKKQFIKNNLYGVDIDPGAIEIAKLRIWLALIVDYELSEIEPLPNLDFQFRVGNSLQEKIDDIDVFNESAGGQQAMFGSESEYLKMKQHMIEIKDKFYESDSETEKKTLKADFDELEHKLIHAVLKKYNQEFEEQILNRHLRNGDKLLKEAMARATRLEQKIKDGTYKLFKPDFHFSEVFDRKNDEGGQIKGFDIVIGNPPYGVKVDESIKDAHELGSKDSYGVFISTALRRFLKPNGILSFIVSDTWLTIKTHKPLRAQVLDKQLHKIVRVSQDCFDATVNACILSLNNSQQNYNKIIAADLTNISTREEVEELRDKLYNLERYIGESTPKFGIYEYPQDLIKTNSSLPIFVGNPKLFELMNDTTCKTIEKDFEESKKVSVRQIEFNGEIIELVRLGDIADVKVGLQTGDNAHYLFQNPEARGNYRDINSYKENLLNAKDLEKIINNDMLRLKIIAEGFHKSKNEKNFDDDLWFDGRYIAPYDKGGESDTESGWLPNYYVPTNYYIDWSKEAVNKMKTHTIAQRIKENQEDKAILPHYHNQVAAVFRNTEFYFKEGISFSITGIYAPSFRINSIGVFDVKGSYIAPPTGIENCLGILSSKAIKLLSKLFLYNCVDMQVDAIKEIPFVISDNKEIQTLVSKIIEKQKMDPRYDYMSNEQKEIDKLVYEMYGLDNEDIREVETWYARRYPKLARFCEL